MHRGPRKTNNKGYGVFGQRLKAERIRRGFTVYDFAAAVGVTADAITKAENAGRIPKLYTVAAMAGVLDCTIDWLAGLED